MVTTCYEAILARATPVTSKGLECTTMMYEKIVLMTVVPSSCCYIT